MALKPCSECGAQISTAAASCPQCDAPQKRERKRRGKYWLIFFVVIGVLFIIGVLSNGKERVAGNSTQEQDAKETFQRIVQLTPDAVPQDIASVRQMEKELMADNALANAQQNELSTPIDSGAAFSDELEGQTEFFEDTAKLIRASGYKCDSISYAFQMLRSRGFVFACNGAAYTYNIEDKGGTWRVTVK